MSSSKKPPLPQQPNIKSINLNDIIRQEEQKELRVRITSDSPKNAKDKLELIRQNSDKIRIASERDMPSSRQDGGSRVSSRRNKTKMDNFLFIDDRNAP